MKKVFGITVTSTMRHAVLYRAAKENGGVRSLSLILAVPLSVMYRWINLKDVPSFLKKRLGNSHRFSWHWSKVRIQILEKKLFDLTGQTFDELWPAELCSNTAFLEAKKVVEQTKMIPTQLMIPQDMNSRFILPPADEIVSNQEISDLLSSRLQNVLNTLSYIERRIIKLRYGLGSDGYKSTLEEVGYIFKISPERVRQIENKAMRKMQQPKRSSLLVEFLE